VIHFNNVAKSPVFRNDFFVRQTLTIIFQIEEFCQEYYDCSKIVQRFCLIYRTVPFLAILAFKKRLLVQHFTILIC